MEPQGPIRLLHLTDHHLFANREGVLHGTITYETLSAVIEDIRHRKWRADAIVTTGDLIQDDSENAYIRFQELIKVFGLPVYCVPGNHDIKPLMQKLLSEDQYHYCPSVHCGDWLITGIDSCVDGEAGGFIAPEILHTLRQQLAQTQAKHVAVLLHHPPLPMQSKWLDAIGLKNSADFMQAISISENVRTAIFGHVHQEFDQTVNRIRVIGTPSTCAQFKPFNATFQLDDKPPAYRRIDLQTNGTIETKVIWIGKRS